MALDDQCRLSVVDDRLPQVMMTSRGTPWLTIAREYISLVQGISDESTIEVEILPKIDNALGKEVLAARTAVHELAERQRQVAALSRAAAKDLARSGLSGADIAVVLDVSPQRVSQLLNA
ncbi:MAG: hypothetical protein ACYDDW_18155 [Dermatophilaceae bacterium]